MSSIHPTSFNTIIVGVGISGLAAATSLARKGHHVRILELNEALSDFVASIQITPNATRILYAWGLRQAFEKVVDVPDVMNLRTHSTGDIVGAFPLNPHAEDICRFP
jgi:salicylate hydroxylase